MHYLAFNNKYSHGVEGSETEDLLYYSALQVSFHSHSEPKALWVVVMYTMNNQTYNTMESVTVGLTKHCI